MRKLLSLKPTTRVAYEHSQKKFAEWLGVEGTKGIAIALCVMKSSKANLSPSAANPRMQGFRSMVKLARTVGFIEH